MEILYALILVAGAVWWVHRRRHKDAPRDQRHPAPAAQLRFEPVQRRRDSTPKRQTSRGELFGYAREHGQGAAHTHSGPFAVVDIETTGFSPRKGDRIIEIAVARIDRLGNVEDEYTTLVTPDRTDLGPTHIHGISGEQLESAPRFADVIGQIAALFDGAVVVAHNASFEERFLAHELSLAGVPLPKIPALCTLWLSRQALHLPDYKLKTVAETAGIPLNGAHTAVGDVRATAALLPFLLDQYTRGIGYPCQPSSQLLSDAISTKTAVPNNGQPRPPKVVLPRPPQAPLEPKHRQPHVRRCGSCRKPGHNRRTCPEV